MIMMDYISHGHPEGLRYTRYKLSDWSRNRVSRYLPTHPTTTYVCTYTRSTGARASLHTTPSDQSVQRVSSSRSGGGGVAGSTTRIQKARVWGERAGGIDQFPGSEDSSSIGLES